MNLFKISTLFILLLTCYLSLSASDSIYYETWDINNLKVIGGHNVEVLGNPQVVSTELGEAVKFDGNGDQLIIDFNPIMDAKSFTVELLFKPDACYPNNTEPRFVHIQDPNDPKAKRVMIELRVNKNNECYMDGFINTDNDNLALISESLTHPTGVWQHVAITYSDSVFTNYFNGVKELSGTVYYSKQIVNTIGKTSLGARMNKVAFYAGLMKTFKVTHAALDPKDFIFIHDVTDTSSTNVLSLNTNMEVAVFPNPVDQKLSLKINSLKVTSTVNVSIVDLLGKVIYTKEHEYIPNDEISVNTSCFKEGVYFVKLKSDRLINTKRLIIKHSKF